MSTPKLVCVTIYGEPASKANSRRIFRKKNGGIGSIKSDKALKYVEDFSRQCPKLPELYTEDVYVEITIYYATRRPDLDESVILDCLQGKVYANDRQVKKKLITWGLDRDNPRSEIKVMPLDCQEGSD